MSQLFWFLLVIGLGTAAYAIWRPSVPSFLIAGIVNAIAALIRFF